MFSLQSAFRSGIAAAAAAILLNAPLISAQAAASAAANPPSATAKQRNAAEAAYLSGAKHLEHSEFQVAEQEFARAAGLDPARPEYVEALALAREHRVTALLQRAASERPTNAASADKLLQQARTLDSTNPRITQRDSAATQPVAPARKARIAGVIRLQPGGGMHSFHTSGDVHALADQIAAAYGLRVAVDPDVKQQPLRIDVDDVNFISAMRVFSLLSGTFYVPLDEHTLVVAPDTTENRTRYEHLVEETFYLPGYAADQLKDFVSIAQQLLNIKQVTVSPQGGSLLLRGPEDRVAAVEKVFNDLLQSTGDVVLDVKLYAVEKQNVRNLGVALPSSVSALSLASEAQSIVSANSSLVTQLVASGVLPSTASVYDIAAYLVFGAGVSSSLSNTFLLFGGGLTTGVLSAGSNAAVNLALTQSDARSLDDLQLRVNDRQRATFKSGTRYPIQTSLYSDIATSSTSSATVNGVSLASLLASYLGTSTLGSGATVPQIQYEDLGLTVVATPRIQLTGDVGMHLEVKVSALAGSALNGIPILANRQFSSDLTIHDGETMMMISNTTNSETAAVTGLPGLSEIPGFQSTTNRNSTKITGDLVLLITPHIARKGHTQTKGPYIPLSPRKDDE